MIDCVVCLQVMTPPIKVLSCGHSFCLRCVRQMRRQSRMSFGKRYNKMSCPTCRTETLLPRGRASMLPNNYALHDVLEVQKKAQNESKNETAEGVEPTINEETNESLTPSSQISLNSYQTIWTPDEAVSGQDTEPWWDEVEPEEDEESDVDDNWFCPNELCQYYNYTFRQVCRWCRTPRATGSENFQQVLNSMDIERVINMLNSGRLNLLSGDTVNDLSN